jgi:hypothetical protein
MYEASSEHKADTLQSNLHGTFDPIPHRVRILCLPSERQKRTLICEGLNSASTMKHCSHTILFTQYYTTQSESFIFNQTIKRGTKIEIMLPSRGLPHLPVAYWTSLSELHLSLPINMIYSLSLLLLPSPSSSPKAAKQTREH